MRLSPFPGMDPFLESPGRWSGFHSRFINSLSDYLSDRVTPNFYVEIQEYVNIVTPIGEKLKPRMAPDVFVGRASVTGIAVATVEPITAPTIAEPLTATTTRVRYLEIRDTSNREVVTTIEVVSPFNKASGAQGREDFLRKRQRMMATNVHWIEIDLLRAGERPTDFVDESDYYALLKRGEADAPYEIWYFNLRDILPIIAVPLRPPFPDAPLNLQMVFNHTYTRGHYADSLDYTARIPSPLLRPTDAEWVEERLRQWASMKVNE